MDWLNQETKEYQLKPENYSNTSMSKLNGLEHLSKPISFESIGAYKTRLSQSDLAYFEKIAGVELFTLGY